MRSKHGSKQHRRLRQQAKCDAERDANKSMTELAQELLYHRTQKKRRENFGTLDKLRLPGEGSGKRIRMLRRLIQQRRHHGERIDRRQLHHHSHTETLDELENDIATSNGGIVQKEEEISAIPQDDSLALLLRGSRSSLQATENLNPSKEAASLTNVTDVELWRGKGQRIVSLPTLSKALEDETENNLFQNSATRWGSFFASQEKHNVSSSANKTIVHSIEDGEQQQTIEQSARLLRQAHELQQNNQPSSTFVPRHIQLAKLNQRKNHQRDLMDQSLTTTVQDDSNHSTTDEEEDEDILAFISSVQLPTMIPSKTIMTESLESKTVDQSQIPMEETPLLNELQAARHQRED